LEPEGPREIARIAHQLNLLYQRLRRSFREVREEKERAELATKAKSRFLSVMSHEIRTPLNAMLGLTDVLLLSRLEEDQLRHLRILQRSGESLLRILNDILDFSRLEAGKLRIEIHEFGLFELLRDVESLMRVHAESKGLRFRVVAPSRDYRLRGDSIRIRQALLNLVGNAVKFTASGNVEIRVTPLQEAPPDPQKFLFEVTDSGIGMSPEQQDRIFSEFSQADASITRRYGGTGLGLSISRHIIELLGGKISVTSELGKGSTFRFTIPLPVVSDRKADYGEIAAPADGDSSGNSDGVDSSRTASSPVSPSASSRVSRSVLVVDDDEDNQKLMEAYLGFRHDLRRLSARSAREALEILSVENVSLVLMDMQMPEMDGIDATEEIRKRERESGEARRRIVILSANTSPEDRARAILAGADEHLAKPIKLEDFRALLSRWLPTA
jgi:CheY-like chemotaxis protein